MVWVVVYSWHGESTSGVVCLLAATIVRVLIKEGIFNLNRDAVDLWPRIKKTKS
jgi:hypothetical protein